MITNANGRDIVKTVLDNVMSSLTSAIAFETDSITASSVKQGDLEPEDTQIAKADEPVLLVRTGDVISDAEDKTWGSWTLDIPVIVEYYDHSMNLAADMDAARTVQAQLIWWWNEVNKRTSGYGAIITTMTTGDGWLMDVTSEAPVFGREGDENDPWGILATVTATIRLRIARE